MSPYDKYWIDLPPKGSIRLAAKLVKSVQETVDGLDASVAVGDFFRLVLRECDLRGVSVQAPEMLKIGLEIIALALSDRAGNQEVKHHHAGLGKDIEAALKLRDAALKAANLQGGVDVVVFHVESVAREGE